MNIKEDSWHWKYVAKKWDEYPESFCWYFWKIPLTLIWWGAVTIIVMGLLIFALLVVTFPIWQWFNLELKPLPEASFIAWVVIGAIILYHYRQYLYKSKQIKPKVHVTKEPGLISEYIHAKHRKICPLLNYEAHKRNVTD